MNKESIRVSKSESDHTSFYWVIEGYTRIFTEFYNPYMFGASFEHDVDGDAGRGWHGITFFLHFYVLALFFFKKEILNFRI